MYSKRLAALSVLVYSLAAATAGAQASPTRPFAMPDSAQMSAMMGRALRRMQPAQFVLDHRVELALTPEQIPYLESLVLAEVDSARVRTARRMATIVAEAPTRDAARASANMSWTGVIDESAIREMSRQQAEQSAQVQIDLARDRHAVGAVLTPTQVATLSKIEATEMTLGFAVRPLAETIAPRSAASPYFEFQVDKRVAEQSGSPGPRYPEALRASNRTAEVLVQFVVDSAGRYEDGSFKVLKTDHALFTQAVRDALPQMRFVPAEVGGTKVRQLVQRSFVFTPGMK